MAKTLRPWIVRVLLAGIRVVSLVVPRRDRDAWRREWEGELVYGQRDADDASWRHHMTLARRASGSISDAAWLRRQFTRDSDMIHDFRHAFRLYRRSPGMVALVAAVLVVGIGATTAVFSAVEAVLLRPVPFADADRLVMVWERTRALPKTDVAPANFFDWRDRATADFEILAAAEPFSRDYTGGTEPEIFSGSRVTEGFFDAFRVTPQYGRLLDAEDFRLKRNVMVMSDRLWKRRFGGTPDAVGRTIQLDGTAFELVGILPAAFAPNVLGEAIDVWTPKTVIEDYERRARGDGYWNVVGKLRVDRTIAQAQHGMDAVTAQIASEQPQTARDTGAVVMPMRTHLANGAERPLLLLGLGTGFILLLALGSVANLQLSLLTARVQEFAVRTALGARRPRLVRQVFVESATIAAVAVGGGIVLAAVLLAGIRAVSPDAIAIAGGATLNMNVLAFAAGIGLLTATLASVLPVMTILRSEVTSGVRGGLSQRSQIPMPYGRSALVVVQIALALMLLVSAGLFGRSFVQLLHVDAGLDTRHLLALQVFAYDRQQTAAKRTAFFAETVSRLRALPGVDAAGAASTVPFLKADINIATVMTIPDRATPPDAPPRVYLTSATPGYFDAAGIPLRRGRLFTVDDRLDTRTVAVINEVAARQYWPGEDPIGRTIQVSDNGRKKTAEIVGIVGDLRYGGLEGATRPEVFLPHAQSPSAAMTYVIRTRADAPSAIQSAKQAVWSVDPLQTFYEAGAVTDMIQTSLRPRVFALRLVSIFAGVGFLIAMAGAYGAVAWALRRRTAEFGIRLALGAQGADIRRHMLTYATRLALTGIAIGLAGALVLGGMLRTFLFQVNAADPLTLVAVSAGLLLAVAAAAYLPARRAGKIDPVIALRV